MTQLQNFTVKVTKREDGKYVATTPNLPGKSAESSYADVAASQLNKILQDAVKNGEIS